MNTIVVTGVSRGLGKELHDLLMSDNYIADEKIFISRSPLNAKASALTDYLCIDLSLNTVDYNNIKVADESQQIVFINNASVIDPIDEVLNISSKDIEGVMQVNCWSALEIAKHLAIESERIGADLLIFNISTGAANHAIRGWIAYCVSKAAIKIAIDVLVEENQHITAIHFDPGVMDTDMQTAIRSSSKDKMQDVELFQNYKLEGKLKVPSQVAQDILKIIKEL